MQNKGSMLAFMFVLLVMCLGGWAAFSTLTSGRGTEVVAQATRTPTEGLATQGPDVTAAPTDIPTATPAEGFELSTPVVPSPTPVPPTTPTPPPSPTATGAPSPTSEAAQPGPPPSPGHQFEVIRNERDCSKQRSVEGWVYDGAGNGLTGAILSLYTDGWSAPPLQSEGPPNAGKYGFALGSDAGLFHLLVVDGDGNPLSRVVDIDYQPDCSQRIDWERVG